MYRSIQDAQKRMTDLQRELRAAILGTDTRQIGAFAGTAHGIAEDIKFELESLLDGGSGGVGDEARFAQAALDSVRNAILSAQKVALGTTADELRGPLLDFKTHADYADAYLHAALGTEME